MTKAETKELNKYKSEKAKILADIDQEHSHDYFMDLFAQYQSEVSIDNTAKTIIKDGLQKWIQVKCLKQKQDAIIAKAELQNIKNYRLEKARLLADINQEHSSNYSYNLLSNCQSEASIDHASKMIIKEGSEKWKQPKPQQILS